MFKFEEAEKVGKELAVGMLRASRILNESGHSYIRTHSLVSIRDERRNAITCRVYGTWPNFIIILHYNERLVAQWKQDANGGDALNEYRRRNGVLQP